MEKTEVIKSIGKRSGGDIYLGVVGAVRTGKSTFIRKFMENLIIPNITDEYERKRCLDELPQAAAGKTIMTTEPKFIPSTATKIEIEDFTANIRMIDCVGYIVPSAKGYEDENGPRLVMTPWYQEPIPFIEAAEIGTEKVIKDHSTIGIVVTTDGSIGEIPRNEYLDAEKTVIEELESIGKPYIVLLNSTHPMLPDTERLADKLKDEYKVPVLPINIETMQERDMYNILKAALYEFPIEQIKVNMPEWIAILKPDHYLKKEYINRIKEELKVIKYHHFEDYFLIVADYTNWAKENGIAVGPGRGSGCNCLVNYALFITDVDPILFDLDFSRFLRIDKKKMPDIDLDFETSRRPEVINYLLKRYPGHSAQICSYGLYRVDNLINDLSKICGLEENKTDKQAIKRFISEKIIDGQIDMQGILDSPEAEIWNEQ